MSSNGLTFNQVSTVMNEVYKLATGQETTAAFTGGDVVSVAQKTLLSGYDNFIGALSQVIARTIFSSRSYNRKFRGLQADSLRFGQHVRKLSPLNKLPVNNASATIEDGGTVDPFKVSKHKAVQFNFYGENVWEYDDTMPDWQVDNAVRNEAELAGFLAMFAQDTANTIEKYHEETARFTLGNLITGVAASRTNDVIHLLTEYNTQTGLELTANDVYKPDNFPAFMKWVYGRVAQISSMMTEYSINYHTNITDGIIMRHTPQRMQKVYLSAPTIFDTTARVLADTYHDNFLRFAETEIVNYWQDIDNPNVIKMTPTILKADGTIAAASAAQNLSNVFGVIFDEEAAGYTVINYNVRKIYNPKGQYTNTFWSFVDRYWNDFTENAVVLLLD